MVFVCPAIDACFRADPDLTACILEQRVDLIVDERRRTVLVMAQVLDPIVLRLQHVDPGVERTDPQSILGIHQ